MVRDRGVAIVQAARDLDVEGTGMRFASCKAKLKDKKLALKQTPIADGRLVSLYSDAVITNLDVDPGSALFIIQVANEDDPNCK